MKDRISEIIKDLAAAITSVEEKHGVTINFGNRRYDHAQFSTKMTVRKQGGLSREEEDYDSEKSRWGLVDRGTVITIRNKKFTIHGFNPKASKNCIIFTEIKTGARYTGAMEVAMKKNVDRLAV